ncbi:hypothetical protein BDZ94DRAFT_1257595 [Collybia nuda]|uniref:F-box domain-containing protein n=1 Tax=Collybia nuda TaxID=64659 RepID=A0A9P6CKH1_9AGAR|nr:hypothetical protein BDZ94DRAFT_1257595 [Collybia nuda]
MGPPKEQPTSWDKLLPSELITRIFGFAILEGLETGSTSVDSSALLFGRVSKRWREIAYSTPTFWTSISVNINHSATISRFAPGVRAWLLRAGALPLSVRLRVSCASERVFPQLALLTGEILSFSPQIRRLFIQVIFELPNPLAHHAVGTHNYVALGKGGFPILETMDLDCPFDRSDMVLPKILASAPALRDFSVMNYPETISKLPVPLAQLRRFVCGPHEPPTTAQDMVRRAPELEECRLGLALISAIAPSTMNGIVTLNHLRHLHIGPINVDLFLNGLSLPALTHLTFDGTLPNSQINLPFPLWHQESITAFLKRSQCALEQLSFSKTDLGPQDIEICVELASPTLKVLSVSNGPYWPAVVGATLLERLTAPTAGQEHKDVLCPLLERVEMHGGVLEREGYGSGMLDMLESRFYRDPAARDGVVQLKSAVVGGTFGPLQRKRMNKLKKDGLNLRFIPEGNSFLHIS